MSKGGESTGVGTPWLTSGRTRSEDSLATRRKTSRDQGGDADKGNRLSPHNHHKREVSTPIILISQLGEGDLPELGAADAGFEPRADQVQSGAPDQQATLLSPHQPQPCGIQLVTFWVGVYRPNWPALQPWKLLEHSGPRVTRPMSWFPNSTVL